MFTLFMALNVYCLKYCCPYFTRSSEYLLKSSTYPNLFNIALVKENSSYYCSAPNRICRMVLVYKCDFKKMFHIYSATLPTSPSSGLALILTIFFRVMTRCFWKLWNKDFYRLSFFFSFYSFSSL